MSQLVSWVEEIEALTEAASEAESKAGLRSEHQGGPMLRRLEPSIGGRASAVQAHTHISRGEVALENRKKKSILILIVPMDEEIRIGVYEERRRPMKMTFQREDRSFRRTQS